MFLSAPGLVAGLHGLSTAPSRADTPKVWCRTISAALLPIATQCAALLPASTTRPITITVTSSLIPIMTVCCFVPQSTSGIIPFVFHDHVMAIGQERDNPAGLDYPYLRVSGWAHAGRSVWPRKRASRVVAVLQGPAGGTECAAAYPALCALVGDTAAFGSARFVPWPQAALKRLVVAIHAHVLLTCAGWRTVVLHLGDWIPGAFVRGAEGRRAAATTRASADLGLGCQRRYAAPSEQHPAWFSRGVGWVVPCHPTRSPPPVALATRHHVPPGFIVHRSFPQWITYIVKPRFHAIAQGTGSMEVWNDGCEGKQTRVQTGFGVFAVDGVLRMSHLPKPCV